MTDTLHLLPHHRKQLHDGSGLSDQTITACGFYSEDDPKRLAVALNRTRCPKKLAPALMFPFCGPDGNNGYLRAKPDTPRTVKGKPIKYESPVGRANEVFIPPETMNVLDNADIELLIGEGEKKAAKASQEGFPCLGLVGVFGWKNGRSERLLPALDRIEWRGREVRIVFDSDITENPNIQDAESRLAAQLVNRGAKVRCVRLPDLPDGAKCGLDDFLLLENGPVELRRLLDNAEDPTPIAAVECMIPANQLDPATEAEEILAASKKDDVIRLRYWRGSFYHWRRGAYRELDRDEMQGRVIRYLNQHARQLTRTVVNNILDQLKAQSMLASSVDAPAWLTAEKPWPTDELLIARNGAYHLPSLVASEPCHLPPTPKLFAIGALDYDVAPDADRPDAWLDFLNQLWPDDPQSIGLLQEWAGYLLTSDTSLQKILLILGPRRAGKGVICRVLGGLVGRENVTGPTLAAMSSQFGLWGLLNKSVAIIPDARLSGRTDKAIVTERLLSISGEDTLMVDRKCLEPITVRLGIRLVIVSNEAPRLIDQSGALTSRLLLLQLTRSWLDKEDPTLTNRLLDELPAILLWAVGGYRRLRERGHFSQPESAAELANEMYRLNSPIGAFVEAACEVGPDCQVARSELFESYQEWCKDQGKKHAEDAAGFGRGLRAVLPGLRDSQPRVDGKLTRHYVGLRLRLDGWN